MAGKTQDVRIRQIVAGQKIRKLWGLPAQSGVLRLEWAKIPAYFCSKGFMRYIHLLEEAKKFHETYTGPADEDSKRIAFIEHLAAEVRVNPKYLDNQEQYKRFLALGRKKAVARAALLEQLCPYCGHPLPCYAHDIGKVSLDGRGGLVHDGFPKD